MIKQIEEVTNRLHNKKIIIKSNEADACLATAKKLSVGTWIEFAEENNKKFRTKLAWKNTTTGDIHVINDPQLIVRTAPNLNQPPQAEPSTE